MKNRLATISIAAMVILLGMLGLFCTVNAQDESETPEKAPPSKEIAPITPTPPAPVKNPAVGDAALAMKIGVVNIETVFDKYNRTAEYRKLLENEQKRLKIKLEEIKKNIETLQDEINLLDKDSELRSEKKLELDRLRSEYELRIKSGNEILRKKGDEQVNKIYKDIRDTIDMYAKENGYTLIFKIDPVLPDSTANMPDVTEQINFRSVLYAHASLDITGAILKILNKE